MRRRNFLQVTVLDNYPGTLYLEIDMQLMDIFNEQLCKL